MGSYADITFINGLPFDLTGNDVIVGADTTDYITAFGGDDFVFGNGGNDVITDLYSLYGGYSGNDTVFAGAGDDTIISSLDGVNRYEGGTGVDTLDFTQVTGRLYVYLDGSSAAADNGSPSRTVVTSFENVLGSDYQDRIFGDNSNNVLDGRDGGDILVGNAGNDTLYGGSGDDGLEGGDNDDLLIGDSGFDKLYGGAGNDRLFGGTGYDTLFGRQGNDRLDGGDGVDTLHGDLGRDILTGGSLADTFIYASVSESRGSGADRITDFQRKIDKLDVRLVDANANVANDQAFKFIGDKAFSAAGQIKSHYYAASNTTVVSFNTDTDSAAEMSINMTGKVLLSSADFIL